MSEVALYRLLTLMGGGRAARGGDVAVFLMSEIPL